MLENVLLLHVLAQEVGAVDLLFQTAELFWAPTADNVAKDAPAERFWLKMHRRDEVLATAVHFVRIAFQLLDPLLFLQM